MPLGVLLAGLGVALVGRHARAMRRPPPRWRSAASASRPSIPKGARFANQVSGDRRGQGMSFFSLGGNAGFALGPDPRHAARPHPRPARDAAARRHPDDRGRGPRARPRPAAGASPPRSPRTSTRSLADERSRRGRLERVRAPGRRRRAALVRLLRPSGLHPAVVHPPARHRRGRGQRGADRDARGRRGRDLLGRARRRPRRAPAPGGRVDRPHHPGARRARARAHPADGWPAHRPGGLPHHPDLLDHRRHEPGVPAQPPGPRLRGEPRAWPSGSAGSRPRAWASSPTRTGCPR